MCWRIRTTPTSQSNNKWQLCCWQMAYDSHSDQLDSISSSHSDMDSQSRQQYEVTRLNPAGISSQAQIYIHRQTTPSLQWLYNTSWFTHSHTHTCTHTHHHAMSHTSCLTIYGGSFLQCTVTTVTRRSKDTRTQTRKTCLETRWLQTDSSFSWSNNRIHTH